MLSIAHNAVADSNRRRTDALRAQPGVEVALLSPRWWYEEGRRVEVPHDAGWRVGATLATGNGTRHVYVSGLVGLMRTFRPDIVDLFEEPFSLVALQALLARDLLAPRAALVFYSAVDVDREWRLPYRLVERLMLRRADGAHGPNRAVPALLRAKGLAAGPVATIPLGVDVARFGQAQPPGTEAAPRPRVGFLGRLEAVKGVDVLLDAFARVDTRGSLVVVGDGPERERLLAGRYDPRVQLRPALPFEQVPAFLKSLDVLVLPSVTILPLHREQFGRVLVEAMAAGVAVVGSDSGAIPEVIGDAGLVVPERNPRALAAAIQHLLDDARLRQTLIARGRQRAAERFDWSVVAAQTVDLFRAALDHRRAATQHLVAVRA